MSSTEPHAIHHCPTCSNQFTGKFCNVCGEKVFHPSDLSIKKFTTQTVDIFTHFDSKFLRSFKQLFFSPGFLPKAYVTGLRVKYAKPMQVFLLCNIIFYFITHISKATDYSPGFGDHQYFLLSDYWIFSWLKGIETPIIKFIDGLGEAKMAKLGLSADQFMESFHEHSWIYSKTFVILLIPLFSLWFWVVFGKKFKYFGSAVVFSIYFVSFQLVTFSIFSFPRRYWHIDIFKPLTWLFYETPVRVVSEFLSLSDFELVNLIFWVPYLFIAFNRMLGGSKLVNFIVALISGRVIYYLTFGLYKKILIVFTVVLMQRSH